ncbi:MULTISPECIES: FAD:protein FMN transferase [Vibrio]|uniref:FAD:protein FMN transferase n=1 Tax=Vibrio proteolyticus NBRC 13287 TaxID=1219065 RepID=U3BMU7_VIBPR|nr:MULTISPECIES: FAD:protein FMN transferase [Vibrio]NAW56955.1 FAD:protein FMN transferase ApbE [Vibrio sp. V36_P2S2PM302]NAX22786.1 FAD:protein FMN transferase ApbE [Vibrio sp. V39_P1S14PM300]NAX27544.1 FAD:protein FMN transferase ApbE [Vibrio sp. V38_P2S17PM301]NAX28501.1 FAD:protein FMN transferase ApbE [Vibrio sp. V37_P2S8PM304]GAD67903.1 thiamine biosynthesis lipoprotein ApbE [Vibrio proteolyticus NBRC 13287]
MKHLFMRVMALMAIVLSLAGCGDKREQVHLSGSTMGTYYSIKYITQPGLPVSADVQAEIDKRLELVNDQMSTYRPDSELSRFNQHKSSEPFQVSAATAKVVREALRISELSKGAYDVTVGPLVNLWSFGPEARPEQTPSEQDLAERRAEIGYQNLSVTDDNKLVKQIPGLYVDLSSIAKGYGVDVVAEYLQELGVVDYMVDVGGELRVKGTNLENVGWRIAIEKPLSNERAVQDIIQVGDNGIATSGDYRNYFEENGVRYSHLINPRTGKPIANHVVSVTVISPQSMTADAYATTFSVMGEEESIALANKEKLPVLLIVKTEDGFKEYASDTFAQYVTKKN